MVEAAPETQAHYTEYAIEEFLVRDEPYYRPIGDEIELFTAAYRQHIPVLLKGPTGCGKTRFVEYMAWQLGRPLAVVKEKGGKEEQLQEGELNNITTISVCHDANPLGPSRLPEPSLDQNRLHRHYWDLLGSGHDASTVGSRISADAASGCPDHGVLGC